MDFTNLSVDSHTHIFCWGENPKEGFLSKRTQKSIISKLLLRLSGIKKERGDTISEKIYNRLFKDLESTELDYIVLFAQDAIYKDGIDIDYELSLIHISEPTRPY